jgi:hypothetical protein
MWVGRLTCSPADALRARPAICGALGRASVNSGATNGAQEGCSRALQSREKCSGFGSLGCGDEDRRRLEDASQDARYCAWSSVMRRSAQRNAAPSSATYPDRLTTDSKGRRRLSIRPRA